MPKWIKYSYIVLAAVMMVASFLRAPFIHPDSYKYIDNLEYVLPLLPLCIDFFQLIFNDYAIKAFCIIMTAFNLIAVYVFQRELYKYFRPHSIVAVAAIFLMLIPVGYKLNQVITELLSYPLSLLTLTAFWRALERRRITPFFVLLLLLNLLLRAQNQIFYVLLLFLIGYIIYVNRKIRLTEIALTVLVPVSFYVVVQGYLALFATSAGLTLAEYKSVHKLMNQLYVADVEDYKLFEDPKIRKRMKAVLKKIDEEKRSFKYMKWPNHYEMNVKLAMGIFGSEFPELRSEESDYSDKLAEMRSRLLRDNFKKNIVLIAKRLYQGKFFYLSLLGMSCLVVMASRFRRFGREEVFFVGLAALSVLNSLVVYAFARANIRYFLYVDIPVIISISYYILHSMKSHLQTEYKHA